MDRRTFLRSTGSAAGYAAFGSISCARGGRLGPAQAGQGSYGPLRVAGPELSLPEGFSYIALGEAGAPLSDGFPTPGRHDGMCALPMPNGNIRLIRNHEIFRRFQNRQLPGPASSTYDARAAGGTTSLEIDVNTREIVRHFVSLDGTLNNCAGGPTPWGSWLTCEEAIAGPRNGFDQPHGYIFEVPGENEGLTPPVPLKAMGRFVHEAVAVDPRTGIVYETEDQNASGLFRFIPNEPYSDGTPANLEAGGRLQMLAIEGRSQYDTSSGQRTGVTLPVVWVDIADPDPPEGAGAGAVFRQGWDLGGARFKRLEGAWYQEGVIFVDCTTGGDAESGQIWAYRPDENGGGELELIFESPGPEVLDHPDNICVSPRVGSGLVLCEDGVADSLFVRGLTPDGLIFDFAQNLLNDSEFAGSVFSPDGSTMFLNIQRPGITLAIWGPWENGSL